MARTTKIKDKETGEINEFTTQQYEVGLYVIVNNDPSNQFGLNVKEDKFHEDLIKKAKELGDEII